MIERVAAVMESVSYSLKLEKESSSNEQFASTATTFLCGMAFAAGLFFFALFVHKIVTYNQGNSQDEESKSRTTPPHSSSAANVGEESEGRDDRGRNAQCDDNEIPSPSGFSSYRTFEYKQSSKTTYKYMQYST